MIKARAISPSGVLSQTSIRIDMALALVTLAVYFTYYFVAGYWKAGNFVLGMRDSAIYETALWQAGHLENPITYVIPGVVTLPLTGAHFMPAGFVYGQIYRFFPGVDTTVVIYAISFTVAGFFVYLLARFVTGSGILAIGSQIVYLAVFTPGLNHFYFEDWAAPYVAAALYFWLRRSYGWATLMWLLALSFKEYLGLVVSFAGLSLWLGALFSTRRRPGVSPKLGFWNESSTRFGILWTAIGALWFLTTFFVIMRWFEPTWVNIGLFSNLGDTESTVAVSVLSNPGVVLQRMIAPLGREYLGGLLLPLAFLPLLGLENTLPIVPIILLNLLPNNGHAILDGVNGHYTTMVEPVLLAGAVVGLVRLKRWMKGTPRLTRIGLAATFALVVIFGVAQGLRNHFYQMRVSLVYAHALVEHTRDVRIVLSRIPTDASVAADEPLLPFLSDRHVLAHLDNVPVIQPKYIVRDSFYGTQLIKVLNQGLSLWWKQYDQPTSEFYDTRTWEQTPSPSCDCTGYNLIYRQGSLALFGRDR